MLFDGTEEAICQANIWLRAADRVLVRIGSFEATDFGQLFDGTCALPWEEWIAADAEFPVNGRSIKSQLSSVPACQKIVKKAIVERLKKAHGVELLEETGPRVTIEVALLKDLVTLTIDTTGVGLHKRGYRTLAGRAPLKETLAAAMVMLSYWRPEKQLVDPFCGTGTIPIEAALIGRNMAPGLHRQFAAESWPRIPAELWQAAREQARRAARPSLPVRIIGYDIDDEALSLARFHAREAGVADDVHFQQLDFANLTSKKDYGCVIGNPPYGQRMGEQEEVKDLYRAMPEVLRRLKTWSHYILTSHPHFEDLVGQKADRRRKLYNGRIECTYFQFHGPKPGTRLADPLRQAPPPTAAEVEQDPPEPAEPQPTEMRTPQRQPAEPHAPEPQTTEPQATEPQATEPQATEPQATEPQAPESRQAERRPEKTLPAKAKRPERPVARPAFGGLLPESSRQAEEFRNRLAKRAHHLRRLPTRQGITCFRLYERDIPEIPLVIDRYEDYLHITEYERPHERSAAEHADWLDLMVRTAGEVLGMPPQNVFMKSRTRQRGTTQHERYASEGHVVEVSEGGLKFRVNLSDYVDTGLFLDHRIARSMVRDAARGKRFLNLFAYTGAFSVYAAAGRAVSTTSVDLSNTYLDWARENMQLNGFDQPVHRFVRDDAMGFLEHHGQYAAYDLAVVDPPTFSNSKKTEQFWDVQRDHVQVLNRLLELMTPGGTIFFSTNFRRFKFAETAVRAANIREITRQTVPPEFRNQRIHRCWRITRDA